jgi:hypothetical protein
MVDKEMLGSGVPKELEVQLAQDVNMKELSEESEDSEVEAPTVPKLFIKTLVPPL